MFEGSLRRLNCNAVLGLFSCFDEMEKTHRRHTSHAPTDAGRHLSSTAAAQDAQRSLTQAIRSSPIRHFVPYGSDASLLTHIRPISGRRSHKASVLRTGQLRSRSNSRLTPSNGPPHIRASMCCFSSFSGICFRRSEARSNLPRRSLRGSEKRPL